MLLGMAAGAALGAVGVMAATQNQRQLRRTTRKVMKGAENSYRRHLKTYSRKNHHLKNKKMERSVSSWGKKAEQNIPQ